MNRSSEPESIDFEIESAEGLPIRGTLELPPDPHGLVVIVHGFKGFKDWGFFPWLSRYLTVHGFASCRFNMSRSGVESSVDTFDRLDLFADDTYSIQLDDLRSVMRFADRHERVSALPRFLLGHSRGGAVALLGASELDVCSVVTWSAIATLNRWDDETIAEWRSRGHLEIVNSRTKQIMKLSTRVLDDLEENEEQLDLTRAVRTIRSSLLVVHGTGDETVDTSDSYSIVREASNASHLLIGSASHTMNAIHPLVDVPPALRIAAEGSARHMTQHCRVNVIRTRS